MSGLTVDTGANRLGSTKNLLDGSGQLLGERLGSHGSGNLNDLLQGDVTVVLDVLVLLSVTRGLLESSNDQRRGRGDDGDGGLSVLDGQLDSDSDTLVGLGGLGDILTNLLGGQTERTNLGSKSGGSSDLTTHGSQVDDLHLIGVKLG